MSSDSVPLLQHALDSPSAFTPERLMDAVRAERGLPHEPVPPLCVLDFDGDLSDRLAAEGVTSLLKSWACFHTSMGVLMLNDVWCGIVPRTIGGPYAVLVAEQLWAAGAKMVVGITSAGRVSPTLPLPSILVVDEAVRDEGTSLHYLPYRPRRRSPPRRLHWARCSIKNSAPFLGQCTAGPCGRQTHHIGRRQASLRRGPREACWLSRCRRPHSSRSHELEGPRWGWWRSSATVSIKPCRSSTPADTSSECEC